MIDIINGYGFKRNHDNTVLVSLSNVAFCLGVQPYLIKEHYYICVADRCFSEGEIHFEEVEKSQIEVYIPCKSLGYLVDSLAYEEIIDEKQANDVMRLLEKHIETQGIVGECFNHDAYDYLDPVRKTNPLLPDISMSVSNHKDYE